MYISQKIKKCTKSDSDRTVHNSKTSKKQFHRQTSCNSVTLRRRVTESYELCRMINSLIRDHVQLIKTVTGPYTFQKNVYSACLPVPLGMCILWYVSRRFMQILTRTSSFSGDVQS